MSRVTWVRGGARRSSDLDWDGSLGWTGFVDGRRCIEEPNPLSVASRKLFNDGYVCSVDMEDSYFTDHVSMIDAVLRAAIHIDPVLVRWFRSGVEVQDFWCLLRPVGRMTPHETWITESNFSDIR
jgi:hypothetical protein